MYVCVFMIWLVCLLLEGFYVHRQIFFAFATISFYTVKCLNSFSLLLLLPMMPISFN